ncbi:hypothetical protein W03_23550 [Nitrosomonas sp. PY1]|uniref:hypothetical protein n=1 Tax=Nitrosomonas sp. PY1 TaxID=1803906 RepID=UPI001FC84CD9|nr:hypothetical protein [Nitrosomonas sp. PY1]GKS70351.1 hypothetical protein W03_23550 [Nitrosomonas sp. PY1]
MKYHRRKIQKKSLLSLTAILLITTWLSSKSIPGTAEQQSHAPGHMDTQNWISYVDPKKQFRLSYPGDFIARERNSRELLKFTPVPEHAVYFMNPHTASGQLSGIEPADLELKVYRMIHSHLSLKDWLRNSSLSPEMDGDVIKNFQTKHINGLEVCGATMVFPGCSIYILHTRFIFQLTPGSRAGQIMIESFEFL